MASARRTEKLFSFTNFVVMTVLSREESLRFAEIRAETKVLVGVLIFIMCIFFIVLSLAYGQYLWAIALAALMVLAVYAIWKANRYAKIYKKERAKAAAEHA